MNDYYSDVAVLVAEMRELDIQSRNLAEASRFIAEQQTILDARSEDLNKRMDALYLRHRNA
jgi:hypothetical protein